MVSVRYTLILFKVYFPVLSFWNKLLPALEVSVSAFKFRILLARKLFALFPAGNQGVR